MKILLVNDVPVQLGHGTENHVRTLYETLKDYGHTPYILTGQSRGKSLYSSTDTWFVPNLSAAPIRKRPLKNFRDIQKAINISKNIINKINPDVVHVHNLLNPLSLRSLRKLGPVVKSIHDCRPFCIKPPPYVATRLVGNSENFCSEIFGIGCWPKCYMAKSPKALVEAWAYFPYNYMAAQEVKKCEKIVVYSRYLQDLAARKIFDLSKIEKIHHFIDFRATYDNEQVFSEKKKILFVGRLTREKGLRQLLEAIKRVSFDCEVEIIGDGPMREEVEELARVAGGEKITLLGYLPHDKIIGRYKSASLVVFPSIGSEGCPLVGLEALANGKPVVGFDTGGVSEWLINEKTGYLVPRGQIGQMAEKIQKLLCEPETAKEMGQEGMRLVARKFRKDLHIARLLHIYEDAIRCREELGFQG